MSCLRQQLALIVAALACAVPATASTAVDTLTIGSSAAHAGSIAHVPVYIRDAAGTALDAGTSAHIQAIAFRAIFTKPELVTGCSTTTFPDCQISFTPAGVMADLHPSQESISTGANSIAVRYVYDRTSQPIAFTLDRAAPGDLIGFIDLSIVSSAAEGADLTFTIDESAQTTALSDNPVPFGGTVSETVNSGLAVTGGTLTISPCSSAPGAAELSITASGCASGTCPSGQAVMFALTVSSTYKLQSCDSILWAFGDGIGATGTAVTHSYTTPGTYSVTATVSNAAGSASTSQQINIVSPHCANAPDRDKLKIAWSGACTAPSNTCPSGASITITADPSQYAFESCDRVSWNFGDGFTATGRTVSHAFAQGGMYDVVMTVTNPAGSAEAHQQFTIPVGGGTCPPLSASDFVIVTSPDCSSACMSGTTIGFTADPAGSYSFECGTHSFLWNFGDGSLASGRSVLHSFSNGGTRTVAVTITSPVGNVTVTTQVTITSGSSGGCPVPSTSNIFMSWAGACNAPDSVCPAGSPIFFGPVFFGFPTSACPYIVSWTFGDGTSAIGTPTHVFSKPGFYNVSMNLTNSSGSVTIGRQFSIQSLPKKRAVRK